MASPAVTYTFTNGAGHIIDADEVNQNFSDVINGITDGSKDLEVNKITTTANAVIGTTLAVGGDSTVSGGGLSVNNQLTVGGGAVITGDTTTTNSLSVGNRAYFPDSAESTKYGYIEWNDSQDVLAIGNYLTGDAIAIYNNGIIGTPDNSLVIANKTSAQDIPNGVETLVTFSDVSDTRGEHSGGTFTANQAGVYQISTSIHFEAHVAAAQKVYYVKIFKNGAEYCTLDYYSTEANTLHYICVGGSHCVSLAAGETAAIYAYQNGTTLNASTACIMSVTKVQ